MIIWLNWDCITFTQESRGETLPPCRKRNILYENICLICNPGAGGEEKEKISPPTYPPSIYVGESSRSLYERGKEHWKNFKAGLEDNHIKKHHVIHHGGEGAPKFHLRPVMFHQTPLARQISEAVRIEKWGEDLILNSKTEFNRCKIGRLTIGEESRKEEGVELSKENEQEEDRSATLWEEGRAKNRRIQEVAQNLNLERGISKSVPKKREGEEEKTRKNKAKLQYPLLGEDWGEEETVSRRQSPEMTPLPKNSPPFYTPITQSPTLLPPPPSTQIPSLPTPQVSTPSTVNPDDNNSQPQESFAQGFPPVYVDPSVDHMHAGRLGEATLRGGTVASPTPQTLPLPTFII